VRDAARKVIDSFGTAPGHVFNLGHGIHPRTPVESVAALIDEVRAYSRRQRTKAIASP
jgi:uroporphyrinogen decarboxylase